MLKVITKWDLMRVSTFKSCLSANKIKLNRVFIELITEDICKRKLKFEQSFLISKRCSVHKVLYHFISMANK